MRFLGVDPGYGRMGFGVIEVAADKATLAECGVIETHSSLKDGERLLEIEAGLEGVLNRHKITYGATEEVFFRKNLTTGIKLVQARGVVILTLARHSIDSLPISPTRMKKMITGNGRADKRQVQQMITRILSLEQVPKPDDAADGLCFAICAWLAYKSQQHVARGKT